MPFCYNCGSWVSKSVSVCPTCGLDPTKKVARKKHKSENENKEIPLPIKIFIIVVFLNIGSATLIYLGFLSSSLANTLGLLMAISLMSWIRKEKERTKASHLSIILAITSPFILFGLIFFIYEFHEYGLDDLFLTPVFISLLFLFIIGGISWWWYYRKLYQE